MRRLVLLALLALALLPHPAQAQALVADLTQHLVAITTGFTGTSVTLFGATDGGGGDIVVSVQGPERETVIRRKSRVAGIWLNTRSVAFTGVPGYYRVLSSGRIEDILSPDTRRLEEIGADALKLKPMSDVPPDVAQDFHEALIRSFQQSGLYPTETGPVAFLGNKLFRATLDFPATVPTGTYSIQVFLVRKGEMVAAQTVPLVIAQEGLEASINDFATGRRAFYGIAAIAAAALVGWLASFIFRAR